MGWKTLGKGIWKNLGDAHEIKGIAGAYARRASAGAAIGAVGGGIAESAQGGSFGEGAVGGAMKGALLGAGTVAFKAAGLGSEIFEEETTRLNKGAFKGMRKAWNGDVNTTKKMMKNASNEKNKSLLRLPEKSSAQPTPMLNAPKPIDKRHQIPVAGKSGPTIRGTGTQGVISLGARTPKISVNMGDGNKYFRGNKNRGKNLKILNQISEGNYSVNTSGKVWTWAAKDGSSGVITPEMRKFISFN